MLASAVPPAADLSQLIHRTGERVELVGTICRSCDTSYFPKSVSCRRPECVVKDVTDTTLGSVGELYSWTLLSYKPPPPFRMDDWTPHLIGLVEVPEGLRIMAMLTGCEAGALFVGMPMILTTRILYRDDSGSDVETYAYRAASNATTGQRQ